jgi:hypothetical protein
MAGTDERRPALENELDALLARVRGGDVRARERREVFRRIRQLETELKELGGRLPGRGTETATARDDPKQTRARWWWLDPGKGAPSLPSLLVALVMGLVLLVALERRCSHVGAAGDVRPAVQHKDPLPARR